MGSEHGEQWESTLLDGWTLDVTRKVISHDKTIEHLSCSWGGVEWVCGTWYRLYYTLSNECDTMKHSKRNHGDLLDFKCGSRSIRVMYTANNKRNRVKR